MRGKSRDQATHGISTRLFRHRRNEMVLLNLVVNGVTLMFAVVSAVTGAFGMNLDAWMPQGTKSSAVRVPSSSSPEPVDRAAGGGTA